MRRKVLGLIGGVVLVIGMSAVAFAQNGQGGNGTGQGQNGGVHHVPEIDPTLAGSAVALLTGGILVIRGRRRK